MINESLLVGMKVGGTTGLTMFAAETLLVEDGRVSVAVAVTCTVFICGVVWWLASRFQKVDDRLLRMEERLEKLPCHEHDCKATNKPR